jgi:LPXTG-motif cell wall-anchored protein
VVTEDALPDYSSERDGADLINHYTPGETSVTVTKAWEDNGNQDGIRPDHILVQLYADGKPVGKPEELNEAGKWSRTWDKLKQKAGKHIIRYTVTEVNVPEGYQSEITGTAETGYRIRNRHVPETRTVSVTKKWKDDGNQDGIRPDHVTIHLLADGKDTGKTLTLKESSGWKGSFQQLEKYREGKEVSYSVSETKVKEYKSKITGSAAKGFTVTNTLVEKQQNRKHQDSDKKGTAGKHNGNTAGTKNGSTTGTQKGKTSGTQSASKPKTGDTNRAAGYLILLGAALGVLGILQKKRKA